MSTFRRPFAILGTGMAIPPRRRTAEEVDQLLGLAPGTAFRVTGVRSRPRVQHETAAELAVLAGQAALQDAGLAFDEVDGLICASGTMDQALPYNAAMVLAAWGHQHRVASFDVGASCLSFLHAVDLAASALVTGRYKTLLLVSADVASFTLDERNLKENGIFADGAAAAVVRLAEPGTASALLAARFVTLPEGVEMARIRAAGSRFHRRGSQAHHEATFEMKGRQLFSLVARELPPFVHSLLSEAHLAPGDIDLVIPHQASRQSLDHMRRRLGFSADQWMDIFEEYGNQVGASLPTTLHLARQRGALPRGAKTLFLGTGAGVSLGGLVLVH